MSTEIGSEAEESRSRERSPLAAPAARGLRFSRRRTTPEVDPFDEVDWEVREARITAADGDTVFEQSGVEVPAFWSATATNIIASKYFRGGPDSPERERSARQPIARVVDTIVDWGRRGGYFATPEDGDSFRAELVHLLLHQAAAFNSPVWFNVGVDQRPQCSACFINGIEDTMPSILGLAKTEGMLFKYGSGTGTNLSSLRSSREALSGGGTASGPVSFMRGYDAFAGVIKSGGRSRRAAKMVILDADHPDILEFIRSKELEERKAWALIEAGYEGGFDVAGGAYDSVFFQNANHSVRVTDEFMAAVERDEQWSTRAVTTGAAMDTYRARELMQTIAEATWVCGDPGLQFDTTINEWHTCPASGRINASNPCSEYMFLDNTACNLASLNLLKFYDLERQTFDVAGFVHACQVLITAQEIIVDNAGYPTEAIERNSHAFRPLGIGYANLGALLMARGVPYDSAAGRDYAAAVTALMTGACYEQSARMAAVRGPFEGFAANRQPMLRVLGKHRAALQGIDSAHVPLSLMQACRETWGRAVEAGELHGLRNSQISVLAPTGTIALLMDCDTTGIEPDIALVKYKRLASGGMIKIVNRMVPAALHRLGYDREQVRAIVEFIDEQGTIEGAPRLKAEHLPVFDCAFKPARGARSIHCMGHLRMVAAVQPFISGAVSKTINMPEEATAGEIFDAYLEAWRLGVKAVAIYRDGCKRSQPLSTRKTERAAEEASPRRKRLPDERQALTHKFSVGGHEGYLTVGMYEDGQPGEIFLVMAKEGSTISGLMDAFATAISIALQHGVPLKILVDKFIHTRFEPAGFTNNPEIPIAKSIMDYIFRWLASKFLDREHQLAAGVLVGNGEKSAGGGTEDTAAESAFPSGNREAVGVTFLAQQDAPACQDCGAIMVRNGTCYKCLNCGSTSGCS